MAIDTTMVRSRRSLLTATLAGLAGAAAATMAGAQRVLAAGDDGAVIHVADLHADVRHPTWLVNGNNNEAVLRVASNQGGTGIVAASESGSGVSASSQSKRGVYAYSSTGTAVHAVNGAGGVSDGTYPVAVLGEAKLPAGGAILGNNYANSGTAEGVQGTTDSPTGYATVGWARKAGTALVGASGASFPAHVPAKTGVYGYAQSGRGVVARGTKAQLRLIPSATASHPSSGALGDLFLDKNKRLWFCKGGTSWVKIV